MEKVNIANVRTINTLDTGDYLIGVNSQGLFRIHQSYIAQVKRLPLSTGSQFALLAKENPTYGIASGLISFNKLSWDLQEVGLFSIHKISSGVITSTSNSSFKFYRVVKDGVDYIAIKKPNNNMANECSFIALDLRFDVYAFEIVNESELTAIQAL